MELRQLEAFAAVMSVGSFTGAAKFLARSQPAVTRLVQELESEIGYPLFARNGPRVTPTRQGFLLFEDAERALASLRQIHARAAEIARGDAAPLLLAAISSIGVGLMPAALQRLEAERGAAPVHLRTASPEQVAHAVLEGAAQLGATSLPLAHGGLQVHWIGELPCVAVLRADDALAQRDVVPLAELARRRLITMSDTSRLRHRIDGAMRAAGQPSDGRGMLIETTASINAQAMVRAGLGVAVLEPLTPHGAPLDGLVVRAIDAAIPFFFGVITPLSRPPGDAVRALADALLAAARALPGFVQHEAADHASLLREDTST